MRMHQTIGRCQRARVRRPTELLPSEVPMPRRHSATQGEAAEIREEAEPTKVAARRLPTLLKPLTRRSWWRRRLQWR
jgi:hypothetical protein